MKVWCNECYGKVRIAMKTKFGDYTLENTDMMATINPTTGELTQIITYPLLKIRVPGKTKKGYSKSKTHIVMPFGIAYCPFCGKKVSLRGEDFEE